MAQTTQQEPAARIARNDSEIQKHLAELCFFRRDAHVAHHGQVAPRANRRAVDCGDRRNIHVVERLRQPLHPIDIALRRRKRFLAEHTVGIIHLLDVPAGTKGRVGPGQDHHADLRIGLHLGEGLQKGSDHVVSGDRVAPLGIVQRNRGDPVGNLQKDWVFTHSCHLPVRVSRTSRG